MNNNDVVRRIRFIYNIKNADMIKIFELGGLTINKDQYQDIMTMQEPDTPRDEKLSRRDLEKFMNGLIISQRGVKKDEDGQPVEPDYSMQRDNDINNVVIKKLKIAMTYSNEDLIEFWEAAGFKVSKGEVGAMLRRKGHPKYLVAGDQFMRKLLGGLAITFRDGETTEIVD